MPIYHNRKAKLQIKMTPINNFRIVYNLFRKDSINVNQTKGEYR